MSAEHGFTKEYLDWLLESVSIDHDGTVANSRGVVTEEFNIRHRTNHKVIDLCQWDTVRNWSLEIGMTKEEAEKENFDLWYKPETLFKAAPVPGAIEFLHELYMRDKNFIINSSRIPELRESTVNWYKIHAPFVEPFRIRTGMSGFEGLATKVNRINDVRHHLHIEDAPEHGRAILDYTHAHVIFLSNSDDLKDIKSNRLTQIKGSPGEMPDFWDINKLFFG